MSQQFLSIILSPVLYLSIIGIVSAFYVAWWLARKQYLGVDKLFNLLALSLASGWFGGWILQSVHNQIWQNSISLTSLWVSPRPLVVLGTYIVIWFVSSRYIRSIRYPYWRLMDILFISLTIVQSSLLAGWVIEKFDWFVLMVFLFMLGMVGGLLWIYQSSTRLGIVAGLQSALFFSVMLFLHLMVPAWHGESSSVEWVADAVGIILGVTLVVLRISAKSEKVILQDIPRGVSQSFSETFTRAFSKKPTDRESAK